MLKAVNVLEQIGLKTDDGGNVIRLNDVARVELGVQARDHATFNGQSCVALFITAADDSKEPMKRIADRAASSREIAGRADHRRPLGPFERPGIGEFALIDISLPDSTSAERGETASQVSAPLAPGGWRRGCALPNCQSVRPRPPAAMLARAADREFRSVRNRQLIRQVRAAGPGIRYRGAAPRPMVAERTRGVRLPDRLRDQRARYWRSAGIGREACREVAPVDEADRCRRESG